MTKETSLQSPSQSVGEKLSAIRHEVPLPYKQTEQAETDQPPSIDIENAEQVRWLLDYLLSKEPLLKEIAEFNPITTNADLIFWENKISEGYNIKKYIELHRKISEWLYALDAIWIDNLMNRIKKEDIHTESNALMFQTRPLLVATLSAMQYGRELLQSQEPLFKRISASLINTASRGALIDILSSSLTLFNDKIDSMLVPIAHNQKHHAHIYALTEKLAKLHSQRIGETANIHLKQGIGTAVRVFYKSMMVISEKFPPAHPPLYTAQEVDTILAIYRNSLPTYHELAREPLNKFSAMSHALEDTNHTEQWNASYFSIDTHNPQKPFLLLNKDDPQFKEAVEMNHKASTLSIRIDHELTHALTQQMIESFRTLATTIANNIQSAAKERQQEMNLQLTKLEEAIAEFEARNQFDRERIAWKYGETAHSLTPQKDARYCPALHTNHIRFMMEVIEATAREYYWKLITADDGKY